eukprot:PhM_4_TR8290/c1_g1_i1/m.40594
MNSLTRSRHSVTSGISVKLLKSRARISRFSSSWKPSGSWDRWFVLASSTVRLCSWHTDFGKRDMPLLPRNNRSSASSGAKTSSSRSPRLLCSRWRITRWLRARTPSGTTSRLQYSSTSSRSWRAAFSWMSSCTSSSSSVPRTSASVGSRSFLRDPGPDSNPLDDCIKLESIGCGWANDFRGWNILWVVWLHTSIHSSSRSVSTTLRERGAAEKDPPLTIVLLRLILSHVAEARCTSLLLDVSNVDGWKMSTSHSTATSWVWLRLSVSGESVATVVGVAARNCTWRVILTVSSAKHSACVGSCPVSQ